MKKTALFKHSQQDQVYDKLYADITAHKFSENGRLPSVRKLADLFDTSSFTVQNALNKLASQGYIIRKPGAGNYVAASCRSLTMNDTVAVCMRSQGHIFADLCSYITRVLCSARKLPMLIDTSVRDKNELMKNVSFSDARYYLIHADKYFPFEALKIPSFKNKIIISLFQWAYEGDDFGITPYRVELDWKYGASEVIRYLHQHNCRNVLLVTSQGEKKKVLDNDLPFKIKYKRNPGVASFVDAWTKQGGSLRVMDSFALGEKGVELDYKEFSSFFDGKNIPDAIVGARDVDAKEAQRMIYKHYPDLSDKIPFIGYGNTPWRDREPKAIASIDMNVEEIALKSVEIINDIESKKITEPVVVKIKPRLVV